MIRPFYFANKRGRKPIGIKTILRMYLMQIGFSLSDEKIFADVNNRLDRAGLMMHGGTIVDASLIAALKSTKNRAGKRDP